MTFDTPAPGLVIAQPTSGFRYTSDAMWLVGFALTSGPRPRHALDLGTGSGVMALLLAAHGIPALGIDNRPEWSELWAVTRSRSRTQAPVELQLADISSPIAGAFDLVLANPPFFAANTGPVAPDPWKRAARTESTATLATFLSVASAKLTEEGRACFVIPREREREIIDSKLVVQRWLRIGRRRSLLSLSKRGPHVDFPEEIAQDAPLAGVLVETATRPVPG